MPRPEPIIRSGPLSAVFNPAKGGRMTRLSHDRHGEILMPTSLDSFDPLNWPKAGAFPLFPYHNRLVGAGFMHDARWLKVEPHPARAGDAMHGPAHRRAWHVITQGPDFLKLEIHYAADADWPFDFHAVQCFHVSDGELSVELSLTNAGRVPMPGGLGWHPYFAADLRSLVVCDATKRWPVNALGVPTGTAPETRAPAELLPGVPCTEHLSDWTEATVLIHGGVLATLRPSAGLPHLVAHRASTYVCLEPASHVAGAFGFPVGGRKGAGLALLEPGQMMAASLSLLIE